MLLHTSDAASTPLVPPITLMPSTLSNATHTLMLPYTPWCRSTPPLMLPYTPLVLFHTPGVIPHPLVLPVPPAKSTPPEHCLHSPGAVLHLWDKETHPWCCSFLVLSTPPLMLPPHLPKSCLHPLLMLSISLMLPVPWCCLHPCDAAHTPCCCVHPLMPFTPLMPSTPRDAVYTPDAAPHPPGCHPHPWCCPHPCAVYTPLMLLHPMLLHTPDAVWLEKAPHPWCCTPLDAVYIP
jgi:hypothetical protein